jgi:hypothetical protein
MDKAIELKKDYYGIEEISNALSPYHKEHQLVTAINSVSVKDAEMVVRLVSYPFTKQPMPYASINLVNLAIEQSLIVHYDNLVFEGVTNGPWNNVNEYRLCVSQGCWLVPKLNTKIISPVPLEKDLMIITAFKKIKIGKRRVVLDFSVVCESRFSSYGIAVFEKGKVFLRKV